MSTYKVCSVSTTADKPRVCVLREEEAGTSFVSERQPYKIKNTIPASPTIMPMETVCVAI